jgi:hypothetical protein
MSNAGPYSLDSARQAAARDDLTRWVADFLASPGSDNPLLADQLSQPPRWWFGPVLLPLDRLHRLAGPPGDPVLCPTDDDEWRDDVYEMKELVEEGWEPPPVIVSYSGGQLVLEDGNHRVESMRRAGAREVWAVIGFDSADERGRFTPPPVDH